jgi:hypothetical protein
MALPYSQTTGTPRSSEYRAESLAAARGAARVEAIVSYVVRDRIQFGYEYASPTLSVQSSIGR